MGQGRPGMGTGFGFFSEPVSFGARQEVGVYGGLDRYRGGFGGGWAVSWFVNAMQGHCKVNPIFCLLGNFVLLLISSFEFSGHSLRNVNYNLFVLTYLSAARLDSG